MHQMAMAIAILQPSMAVAQASTSTLQQSTRTADELVNSFFEKLKAGQTEAAVSSVFDRSDLTAGRAADKQLLVSQIDNAVKLYGAIRQFELVSSEPLGALFVKRYYVVQHDKMLTRWEFDLILTPKGWMAGYFGFDDQIKTWK